MNFHLETVITNDKMPIYFPGNLKVKLTLMSFLYIETTINFLFRQSLLTISSLPFHLLQDTWLWGAFRGDFGEVSSYWNEEYWRLSEEIVGVKSPVPRNPQEDLDITSIFHIIADAEMIRYYVRTILQFQFAEALCATAGHEGDLHDCDFYGSIEAGEKLSYVSV